MPVQRLDTEGYVEIFRRVLPADYVAALESLDDGLGLDLAYAFAAMMALADCASNKGTQSLFLRAHSDQTDVPAQEQAKAVGTIRLTHRGVTLGYAVVPARTALEAYATDSYGSELFIGRYFTKWEVVLSEGPTSQLVDIEAELPGYFGNLPLGAATFRFVPMGRFAIPSQVSNALPDRLTDVGGDADDTWSVFMEGRYLVVDPAPGETFGSSAQTARRIMVAVAGSFAQVTPSYAGDNDKLCTARVLELEDMVAIEQTAAITGGNGGMLDAYAADLGMFRGLGESDVVFGARAEAIADTTTPAAIARAVDAILGPLGVAWRLMETGDPGGLGGFVWDLHPWNFGNLSTVASSAEVYSVQGAVWLSRSQTRRFFVVAVSTAIDAFPGAAAQVWKRVNDIRGFGVGFRLVMEPAL